MATKKQSTVDPVRELFEKLSARRNELRSQIEPLQKKRDELQASISSVEDEMRSLHEQIKSIQGEELAKLDSQVASLARSLGAKNFVTDVE